jgi:uncharacterized protein (DUF983 family)
LTAPARLWYHVGMSDATPQSKELIRLCPRCGSGDVHFDSVSRRPYCAECYHWGEVNLGTDADAVRRWNEAVKESGQ